jgi:membrane protein YdbS with pleckstrin-like domain
LPLQLSGYFGTQTYSVYLIIPYFLYLLANVGFRIWLTAVESVTGFVILNVIGIFLELYIAYVVARFISMVNRISEEDRLQLRSLERAR